VIAAVCCTAPLLVTAVGAVGLTAWLPKAGNVLIPALIFCAGLIGFSPDLHRSRTEEARGEFCQTGHRCLPRDGPLRSRPVPLGFPGAEHAITSDAFLELEDLPKRIVMVGGGYIAAEFSHIAARAGAKVTVLQRAERMLTRFDPELVGWLMETFSEIGIEVQTGTAVEAIEHAGSGFRVRARAKSREIAIDTDLAVHAAGRAPDLDALNLAAPSNTGESS
jgi:NADPH-dependent 2,4-dienoyl-CoA reductase/sulfur reductase-like enzyme